MNWIHPTERDDASDELKILGRAWAAHLSALGGYGENDSPVPQWAQDVFAAFAAKHPGFEPWDCMTPEWLEEKKRSYEQFYSAQREAREMRAESIRASVSAKDWSTLVAMSAEQRELPDIPDSRQARLRIIWGRGNKAVGVK